MNRVEQSVDIGSVPDRKTSNRRRVIGKMGAVVASAAVIVPVADWGYPKVADYLSTPRCGAEMTDPAASYIVTGDFFGENVSASFGDEGLAINGQEFSAATIPDALQLEVGDRMIDLSIHPILTNQGSLEGVIIECR